MNPKIKFWIFLTVTALFCVGCNTEKTSGQGQGDATKPAPQVRVEVLPSATATLPLPTDEVAATPTPETAAAGNYALPTTDVDALADQIEANMEEMERELNNQKFILKP